MKKSILIILLLITGHLCFSQFLENPKNFTTLQFSYALVGQSSTEDNRVTPRIEQDFDRTRIYQIRAIQHRYLIGRYFALGLGTTLTYQTDPNLGYFQVFGDIRGFLSDEDNTVYPFIQVGTGRAFTSEYNRHFILGLGIGYRFFVGERLVSMDIVTNDAVFRLRKENQEREYNQMYVSALQISLGLQL